MQDIDSAGSSARALPQAGSTQPQPFVRARSQAVHAPAAGGAQAIAGAVSSSGFDTRDATLVQEVADLALSLDFRNMSDEQKASGGFLTLPPTFGPAMVRQLASLPSVVARGADGKPAGFMLASLPVENSPSPVLQELTRTFARSEHGRRPWAVYGPIGVGATFQGQGIAPRMFGQLRAQFEGSGLEVLVGFVDARNTASLKLHTGKLGFATVGEFEVNGRSYVAIMYDMIKS
jgi:ribosomal protein S18 acetylase RimI-like enzyme